jgi:hypothetical protein
MKLQISYTVNPHICQWSQKKENIDKRVDSLRSSWYICLEVPEITEGPTEGIEENTTNNYEKLTTRHLLFQSKFFLPWSQFHQSFPQMKASELKHDKKAGVLKIFLSNFNTYRYNFIEINH